MGDAGCGFTCLLLLALSALPSLALLVKDPQKNISLLSRSRNCPDAPVDANPSVAIVLLSRRAPDLKTWLLYHLDYMKVKRVFLQVEDTPDFDSTWQSLPKAVQDRAVVWKAPPLTKEHIMDNYVNLQARQEEAMKRAQAACKQMGIGWLLPIDDDELLYSPLGETIGEILGSERGFDQAHIPNVEAIYNSPNVTSCFTGTSKVNTNKYTFTSYGNGKSAVRVAAEEAVPSGPHEWRMSNGSELCSIDLQRTAFPDRFESPLWLVHFESCPFAGWEHKFWELGKMSTAKINDMPFDFYRQSSSRMQRCRIRKESGESVLEKDGEECSQASLKDLWSRWKTSRNRRIQTRDVMNITIPWKDIKALSL